MDYTNYIGDGMANSEVVTREDLKNVFEALGEGSYGTRIDELEEDVSSLLITRSYTISNLSSSTWYSNYQINVAVSGYIPVAFASIPLNQADKHVYWFYFVGNIANVGIALNQNSGTILSSQITIKVLYVKDGLIG